MKILVTGATGFAGRWLMRELADAGHDAIGAPGSSALDITDLGAVASLVSAARPEGIVHLAGIAFGPDARGDPDRAIAVNQGGTAAVLAAGRALAKRPTVLVVSSSDVYGRPRPSDLPLRESAVLAADQPYGRSKLAAEATATAHAGDGLPIIIARPFNHTGPGQRLDFVVPALAARILDGRRRGARSILAGNVDVARDFSDVRDVVRAYRLLIEQAGAPRSWTSPSIYNIATGRSLSIRDIIGRLCDLAGVVMDVESDPELVRRDDPPDIRGDTSRLRAATGWTPQIPFDETLRSVLADVGTRTTTPGIARPD